MLDHWITKLREPSTITGLVALLGVVGISIPVDLVQYLGMLVTAGAGIYDIYRKDRADD